MIIEILRAVLFYISVYSFAFLVIIFVGGVGHYFIYGLKKFEKIWLRNLIIKVGLISSISFCFFGFLDYFSDYEAKIEASQNVIQNLNTELNIKNKKLEKIQDVLNANYSLNEIK